ncbi:unnamed protein product, partial [marine sediment metagenome]
MCKMPREKQYQIYVNESDKKRITKRAQSKHRTEGELVGYWSELDEMYDLDRVGFLERMDEDYKNGFIQFNEDGLIRIDKGAWVKVHLDDGEYLMKLHEEDSKKLDELAKRYGGTREEVHAHIQKMYGEAGDKYKGE